MAVLTCESSTNLLVSAAALCTNTNQECRFPKGNPALRHSQIESPSHYQKYQPPTIPQQPLVIQNVYQSPAISQQPQAEFPQLDSGLAVPSFVPGDDPIASLNKAMSFLSTIIASRFPTTNLEHIPIQETKLIFSMPKRPRNTTWFKEKILLVQAQESGQVLDKEQLAFLADPGVAESQDTQTTMTHNATFQTDDLDAFDSDCDEVPSAKAVLMANLSSYNSDVIFEVPISDTNQDNFIHDNSVQDTTSNVQQNVVIMSVFDEITNKVAKCNAKNIKNKIVQESLTAELERYKERCSVDNKCFEIQKKELLLENDRLLELIISQDLVHTAINSLKVTDKCESMRKSWCEEYNRNLTLEAELSKMHELSKICSNL
ncbi:hypothetical protein Tco_1028363 [Tanacetum coccineum]|uniref:Uncharacterized protein n=1 Tax=Tanacetum coccineum TaxID=301880 RepID=A0ABQ5G0G8_9ASTR